MPRPFIKVHPLHLASIVIVLVSTFSARILSGQTSGSGAVARVSPRISENIVESQRIQLQGTVHGQARPGNDAGRLNGETVLTGMELHFQLSAAQQADLKNLLTQQQNPHSASYHKWLTPKEYEARFGLADADVTRVSTWLQSHGFEVTSTSPTKITFDGNAALVEQAFNTEMHNYRVGDKSFYANSTELSVPAAIAPVVGGVLHMNDYRLTPKVRMFRGDTRASSNGLTPSYTSSVSGNHFLVPDDVKTIYDAQPLYTAAIDGTGQTIAVIGQTAISLSDVEAFQANAGLAKKDPQLTLVPNTGASQNFGGGDEQESDLDVEYSGAMAPGATVYFVYTGNSKDSQGNLQYDAFTSLEYIIQNNLAAIISSSYGTCEANLGSGPNSAFASLEQLLQEATAQGETIVAAAGDNGAADCDVTTNSNNPVVSATQGLQVDYPASSQYSTGIGGTEFNDGDSTGGTQYWNASNNAASGSAISYIPEMVWNDTALSIRNGGGLSAGGGGASKLTTKPTWQVGTGVPSDGARDVPDISLDASNGHDPYLFCNAGSCVTGFRDASGNLTAAGGTSFGAPIFSGILALINQKVNSKLGQGLITPQLYKFASSAPTAFHDVTTGNNDVPCTSGTTDCPAGTTQIGFSAGTGYDQATGIGTIDANNLATAFANSNTQIGTVTTVVSPATITIGQAATFTATVTPGSGTAVPTGTLQFYVDGTASGSPVTLDSTGGGTFSTTFTTGGTHTVYATYSGDSTFEGSTSATVSVSVSTSSSAASTSLTLSASPTSVNLGANITLTANVTSSTPGTITGSVAFSVNNTTIGSARVVNGVATLATTAGTGFTAGSDTVIANYGGDVNFAPSTATTTVTVIQPTFTLAATAVTIKQGAEGNVPVTVTAQNGYTGTVSLTLSGSSNDPLGALGYNPVTATVSGTSAVSGTILLCTDGTDAGCSTGLTAMLKSTRKPAANRVSQLAGGSGVILGALLLGIPVFTRRRNWMMMAGLLLICAGGAIGCGSGNGGSSSNDVPRGTYTITVTATDNSNSSLSTTTTFALTVD